MTMPDTKPGLRSFNLLPWRHRQCRARRRNAIAALAGGAVAALALVAAADTYWRHELREARDQTAEIAEEIARHKQAGADLAELQAANAGLAVLLAEIERVQKRNEALQEWLARLPDAAPTGLFLTGLRLNGQGWEIEGKVADLDQARLLLGRLRKMPMVSEARIEEVQIGAEDSRQFLLVGRLKE